MRHGDRSRPLRGIRELIDVPTLVTGRSAVGWLVRPAVGGSPRANAIALAVLRVVAGLLWLYNVRWKRPPDFGQSTGGSLYGYTRDAVEHPVFAPYSWVVEHLVLPNFVAFGWLVLVVESLLAVLLLSGTLVRLAALIGVGQSLAITLSVAQTPGEWPWSDWMMIGIHVALLFTAAGAAGSVDAVRAHGPVDSGVRLLRGWGVVAGVVAVVALILSAGADPLASPGSIVGKQSLQVTLGSYNLLGAVVLLAVGVLMLAGAAMRRPWPVRVAAVVAALAAVSLYAQVGQADTWLGGTNASAAFFVCAALVAAVTAGRTGVRSGQRHKLEADR
ncbi:MAG: Rv1678 family membrane protein [Nocardioidaceae bacterium]